MTNKEFEAKVKSVSTEWLKDAIDMLVETIQNNMAVQDMESFSILMNEIKERMK